MADSTLDTDCEDSTRLPVDPEVFVDHHHANKLLEGLNRLRLSGVLCDVVLVCEGQEVPCHRHVLASFSPYFEAMFTCGMMESTQHRVTMSGLEPQMVDLLVNYAYTAEVSITVDNVQALLAASDLLEVPSVLDACCDYMKRHLHPSNCVEFYCTADQHSCETLKRDSLDHILEYFTVIYQQEEFLSLSVDRLTEVLSSDHLNVPEEDLVFEAAMRWLHLDLPSREHSFGQVLQHIRLPLLSPSFLHTVIDSLEVLREHQACQRFIQEVRREKTFTNTLAPPRRTTVIVTLENTMGQQKAQTFDPLTHRWRNLGPLPLVARDYAVVTTGSSMYLAGGQCSEADRSGRVNVSREVWRYHVLHNSWVKKASMTEARVHFSLVVLDGCVFAVGGRGSRRSQDSMEHYDPHTDSWRLMEAVGVAQRYNAACCDVLGLDGEMYFIGGAPGEDGQPDGQVAKFNPRTSAWTQLAAMLIPRDRSAACVLKGKIYVTGGEHYRDGPITNMMECYDVQADQWTLCASMQIKRVSHSMTVVDGRIYALGGRDSSGSNHKVECYCEQRVNAWETVGRNPNFSFHLKCVSLKLRKDHGQPIYGDSDGD